MKAALATPILQKFAKKLGVKIIIEPRYGYAGQITLADGTKKYFRGSNFDLNPQGAMEISKDKSYADFFMRRMGYPTIKGESFFSPRWAKMTNITNRLPAKAYAYAKKLGFPVIVKPNALSQGAGVCKVHNKKEFLEAVKYIAQRDRLFLVQEALTGHDYRLVVLDGEIMSAYERLPLTVVGDGVLTIRQLLRKKQQLFERTGRDTLIKHNDFRIKNKLQQTGFSLSSRPANGQAVALLDNRNLSTGGEAIDVTQKIHPTFAALATKLVKDMGLRYCGVDLMVTEGDITQPARKYKIIETNAAPGVDHYVHIGRKQENVVEEMYLKVLKALIKK